MPVECTVEVNPIGQERFHAVDKVVMRHVFDIHNTLGRFCDDRIGWRSDWLTAHGRAMTIRISGCGGYYQCGHTQSFRNDVVANCSNKPLRGSGTRITKGNCCGSIIFGPCHRCKVHLPLSIPSFPANCHDRGLMVVRLSEFCLA